ncbi:MAG: hypothetical protein CMJ93_08435 [Planctomycetes bacterium]|nr:hypothetical protein [Planctomycetota bacterium]
MTRNKIMHLCAIAMAGFLLLGRWTLGRIGITSDILNNLPDLRILVLAPVALTACYFFSITKRHQSSPFQVWLYLFLGWACLSSLWSIQPQDASVKLVDALLVLVFMLSFTQFSTHFRAKQFIPLFGKYYLFLLAALACWAVTSIDFFWEELGSAVNRKVFAVGSGPNVFGRNMALLSAGLILLLNNSKKVWAPTILAGIPTAFVLLSGSRGALLEFLTVLLGSMFFLRRSFFLRLAIPVLLLVPLGLSTLTAHEPTLFEVACSVQDQRLVENTIQTFHDSSRIELWSEAYVLGMERPIVGVGLGGYEYLHSEGITLHYPHNLVAESWAELGLVGLILILLLGGYFARAYLPRLKSTWGFISAGVITSGIFSMLSGDLYDARTLFCFSLAWILLYNTPRNEQDPGTRPSPSA